MDPINMKCRLCLHGDDPRGLLNLKTERTGELLKRINAALNFKVVLDSHLSQNLCHNCYSTIVDMSKFQIKCLENETQERKTAGLNPPVISKEGKPGLQQDKRHTLTGDGHKLLTNNIRTLNDKVALLTQEREVLRVKIAALEKENDTLKSAVVSQAKALPEITKSMTSLLSRMEQQFLLSHSRIVDGNTEVEMTELPDTSTYILPDVMPQAQINSKQQTSGWTIASPSKSQSAAISTPQVTYICDAMIDHVTEIEINTDEAAAPSPRCSPSPTYYEDHHSNDDNDATEEVNALLVQLCEQQEKRYNSENSTHPSTVVTTSQNFSGKSRKTDHYEVIVPRRSFRRQCQ